MPAYANGQRFVSKNSDTERNWHTDPDASWGHRSAVSTRRGGGFFGYRLHAAVCTATGLPVAWSVETAKANETRFAMPLIDTARRGGMLAATAAMDKGYDQRTVYDQCMERDCQPVIPLRRTPDVKRGEHPPPPALMASGSSRAPTASVARRSGAARPAGAARPLRGSRPTGCTR